MLAQARLIGDLEVELMAMANLGLIDLQLDRYEEAGARLERARVLFREMGRQDAEAEALECLAEVALHRGEIRQALALAEEAHTPRQARALRPSLSALLTHARILEEAGRWSEAEEAHRLLARLVDRRADKPLRLTSRVNPSTPTATARDGLRPRRLRGTISASEP